MEKQRNKVCGADIHKKFLVATILSRDGTKITKRFGMTLDDLLKFKELGHGESMRASGC